MEYFVARSFLDGRTHSVPFGYLTRDHLQDKIVQKKGSRDHVQLIQKPLSYRPRCKGRAEVDRWVLVIKSSPNLYVVTVWLSAIIIKAVATPFSFNS